jgi:hypothetical protein
VTTIVRILLLAAPIGAFDVIWFHVYRFRLFERRESVLEEITHLVRGLLFPLSLAALLLGDPGGLYFWAFLSVFAVDSINSLIDVLSEPKSRAPAGVPRGELAVHVIGGGLSTAAFTLFVADFWSSRWAPTMLSPHASDWLTRPELALAWLTVGGGLILFAAEATLFGCALLARQGRGAVCGGLARA